mmetsp:Transcript_8420/g.24283  ORF Transcript_8420/g.24283 Transcript_8420/m.24283 type:complete len:82 (+) Transcript_8420:68-313(+)
MMMDDACIHSSHLAEASMQFQRSFRQKVRFNFAFGWWPNASVEFPFMLASSFIPVLRAAMLCRGCSNMQRLTMIDDEMKIL